MRYKKYTDYEINEKRKKYIDDTYEQVCLRLHKAKDADVIDVLKDKKKVKNYICDVIREKEGVMTI